MYIMPKNKTKKNKTSAILSPYTAEHFKSNDGMMTTIWGPPLWHVLHTMSFNYPIKPSIQDKRHYRQFVLSLKNVLPCGKCRKNLSNNLSALPLTPNKMQSRDTFSKYIYDLHECVNKMLNKQSALTYEDVRERYEHFRARCKSPTTQKSKIKTMKQTKNEKGCVEPIVGIKKSKCVLTIVPQTNHCKTMKIDPTCQFPHHHHNNKQSHTNVSK